jgi:hypothetical protein
MSFPKTSHNLGHTWASNCLLLGDADARITRLPFRRLSAGRSSGNGNRGGSATFAGIGGAEL